MQRRPSHRSIVLALALVGLAPGRADASCGARPLISIAPTLSHAAPTNTHVWITLPLEWRRFGLCEPLSAVESCPEDTFSLGVRPAPRLGRTRPWTSVTERETPRPRYLLKSAIPERTVELVPAKALERSTLFEVHLRADRARSDEIVGVFRTGDFADTTPPAWQGDPKGTWAHAPPKAGTILLSECGEPTARFEGLSLLDDHTPPLDLLFEVRAREMTEPNDLLRVPDAVKRPFSDGRDGLYLWLGSTNEGEDEGLVPRDQHDVSVSLVVVDWAGNRSDARAFDLTGSGPR